MKKNYLITAAAMMMAGCASDELLNNVEVPEKQEPKAEEMIAFTQKVDNMTRATNRAEKAGHYEFGVFGYKGDAKEEVTTQVVMNDYLVAYGDIKSGTHEWYKDLKTLTDTYQGDENNGTGNTVAANGKSTWFYENIAQAAGKHKTLGSNELTPTTGTQIMKYWDEDEPYHNFYAYMPYYGKERAAKSRVTIADNSGTGTGADLTFTGLSTFYTDPVVVPGTPATTAQIATADERFAGKYADSHSIYNMEVTNANEALYAANSIQSDIYRTDVPFTFRHINAKINVAFWEDIKGYKVRLIDLVPEDAATKISNNAAFTSDKNLSTSQYKGVAFTPATPAQANVKTKPASERAESLITGGTTPLPSYMETATIKAVGVTTGTQADMQYASGTHTNANIRFQTESSMATTYNANTCAPNAKVISEAGGTSATMLDTKYFALPNTDTDNATYITPAYADGTAYDAMKVGSNTGFTMHVSYEIIPEDGTATIRVYDARVYVAPEYCHWQDGKQYTYIFKITKTSNGSTNPNKSSDEVFEDGEDDEPYVDPDDPRIPWDSALNPIVFDGITITDYEKAPTGKTGEEDEWEN